MIQSSFTALWRWTRPQRATLVFGSSSAQGYIHAYTKQFQSTTTVQSRNYSCPILWWFDARRTSQFASVIYQRMAKSHPRFLILTLLQRSTSVDWQLPGTAVATAPILEDDRSAERIHVKFHGSRWDGVLGKGLRFGRPLGHQWTELWQWDLPMQQHSPRTLTSLS